jgi:methylglutaconyl-CoA hydratase
MPLATLDISGPIATLTLRRPDARNSLSPELLADLAACVHSLSTRQDASVAIVTGEGKSFCAGMDLKAVLGNNDLALKLLTQLAELTHALRALPQVTIAKVNGAAIGGGCGLSTVCDISVTHADAKLGFPEVDLGVCPAVVAPWLVRKVGAGRARAILLKGGLLTGAEALAQTLVNHCVPTIADLDPYVNDLAQRLSQGGPNALRVTKQLLNELDGSTGLALLRRETLRRSPRHARRSSPAAGQTREVDTSDLFQSRGAQAPGLLSHPPCVPKTPQCSPSSSHSRASSSAASAR